MLLGLGGFLVGNSSATAQDDLSNSDADLGSRLAMKVLLSSEDALSASRYELDSGIDAEAQQVGVRLRVGDHSSRPFVGAFAGRYGEDESLGLDGLDADFESEFEAVTVGVEAGADVLLAGADSDRGWFLEPRVAVGYSWAERTYRLQFRDSRSTVSDESDAEAWTGLASVGIGRRWRRPSGWRTEIGLSLWWLHSEPNSVGVLFEDHTSTTEHLRLHFSATFPLRAELAGGGLELATGLVHTELDNALAALYDSDRMTEVSVALLARFGDERLPVDAAGFAIRYLTAESFEGWTMGITVSD